MNTNLNCPLFYCINCITSIYSYCKNIVTDLIRIVLILNNSNNYVLYYNYKSWSVVLMTQENTLL